VYGLLLGNPLKEGAFITFALPAFFFLLYWIMAHHSFRGETN
jgi:hypothetical protein